MPLTIVLTVSVVALAVLAVLRIMLSVKQTKKTHKIHNSTARMKMSEAQAKALDKTYSDHGLEFTLQYFLKNIQTSSIITTYSSPANPDHLFQELMAFADSYKVVADHQTDDDPYYGKGKHQLMVFEKGNAKFLVSIYSVKVKLSNVDVGGVQFPVEAFAEGEEDKEFVWKATKIRLVCPTDEGYADVKHETLKNFINIAKLEFIMEEHAHIPVLHTIVDEGYGITSKHMRLKHADNVLSDEDLKLAYPIIEIPVNGDVIKIEMNKLSQFVLTSLDAKANFSFGHIPGTGKSTLLRHLAMKCAEDPKKTVFFLDSSIIELFKDPKAIGRLHNIFSEDTNNVVFIDQAEELLGSNEGVSKTFLDMVDGNLGQEYNLNFVVAYNGDISEFNKAFFRSNRFQDIEITAIDATRVTNLMAHAIENWVKLGEELNHKELERLVNTANRDNRGDVYAASGEITLADFVGCIRNKTANEIFASVLAAQKKEEQKIEKPKATAPKVKPKSRQSRRRNKNKKG